MASIGDGISNAENDGIGSNGRNDARFKCVEGAGNGGGECGGDSGDFECERENAGCVSRETSKERNGCVGGTWENDSGASCEAPPVGRLLAVQRMIVDRFEGEAREVAVCELGDGTFADIPVSDLPEGVREGTVLKRIVPGDSGEGFVAAVGEGTAGVWVIDADEEAARRARIQRKTDSLFV